MMLMGDRFPYTVHATYPAGFCHGLALDLSKDHHRLAA